MKTLFKRPPNVVRACIAGITALLTMVTAPGEVGAQAFNPAFGTEYIFPTAPGPVNNTTHSFTYTMSHIEYMHNLPFPAPPPATPPYMPAPGSGPLTDLTVHSWDDPGSTAGFSYISTATGSGTPGIVYDQGTILYPAGVQDIEVALVQDEMGYNMFIFGTNASWFVVVSYYNPAGMGGPGHYMDVYRWNRPFPWGIGGLTFVSTTQLSAVPVFTRVSMDAHNTYGFVIAWEDPALGIGYIDGFMVPGTPGVSTSPIYTLPGTLGETHPDVTIDHNTMGPVISNGLEVQFVYYKRVGPGNIRITESTVPFFIGPGWPVVSPPPAIRDVNIPLGAVYPPSMPLPDLQTRMDQPDHWTDDFAYCYILPIISPCGLTNMDIYVRYMNAGIANTRNITNGSMGNIACDINPFGNAFTNDRPVVSFDATTNLVNVEWYTQYLNPPGFFQPANVGGYVGIQMDLLGNLTSVADYLQVGELASSSNQMASLTPTIASSRQNDRTNYQYVAFANWNAAGFGNEMHVKDRIWGSLAFKSAGGAGGNSNENDFSALYPGFKTPLATPDHKVKDIYAVAATPNPFKDNVTLNLSSNLLDKNLDVTVQDISGRVIDNYKGNGRSVNAFLGTLSPKLANGTYLIKVVCASENFSDVIKVDKLAVK